jgi:hypothetical protein
MNNALTNYLEDGLMNHLFHASTTYTPAATIYLGLLSALPDDTGGVEVTYTNYIRKSIAFNAAGADATREIWQSIADVTFPQCGVTGDTATHWALYDAETAGNMLSYGALTAPKVIAENNTPSIAGGQVKLTAPANEMSDYLAETILDFAFKNQAFAKPDKYLFLSTTDLTTADTGTTIKASEPANGYLRKQVTAWTVTSNAAENTSEESFPTPSGSWGAITAVGIADNTFADGGNVLFFDNTPTGEGQAPGTGDTVKFSAGSFDVSLD